MFVRLLFLVPLTATLLHAQAPAPAPAAPAPAPPDPPAAPAVPPAAGETKDPHQHGEASTGIASAGRRMELVKDVTEADFLRLGVAPKSVELTVVAVWNDENYGMNFNGYAKGNATYTIPKGWNVSVKYINPSPIPHSLIVIEKESLKKIQIAEPYFKGAAVPDHLRGLAYGTHTFVFTADEAGDYALACGFPAHALNGHWIGLEISDTASVPTLQLGKAEAKPASPAKPK